MKFQLGAMTVGDILDRGLKIMLNRLGVFYVINLLVLTPYILLELALPAILFNAANPLLALVLTLGAVVLMFLLQPIGAAAILHVISEEYVGRRVSLGESLRFALTRFGPLLGTTILAGLIIALGFMLLVVPGIIFWLNYALIAQVVVVEGLSGEPALKRSKDLVTGWRGRVFGIFVLVLVLSAALGIVTAQMEHFLPSYTAVRDAAGRPSVQFNFVNHSFQVLVTLFMNILFSTYSTVCITLVYFDLRVRKEGYDLELAARQEAAPAEVV